MSDQLRPYLRPWQFRRINRLEDRVVPALFIVANTDDAGPGSLRQAVLDANAAPDYDQITFDATAFASAQTITLTTGEIPILESVSLTGPGASLVTINANKASRAFRVGGPLYSVVYLSGMSFTGGETTEYGGAIILESLNLGETDEFLTISNCKFFGNNAAKDGGAVYLSGGSITINNCEFTGNTAGRGAGFGAGSVSESTVQLNGCLFQNNSVTGGGGAIVNQGSAEFYLSKCQITNNTAVNSGGGISSQGSRIFISDSSVTGNKCTSPVASGGGISAQSEMIMNNVLFSGNTAGGGGGLWAQAKTTAVNCAFVNNTGTSTTSSGGGLSVQGDVYLTNCTVHGNTAGNGGGVGIANGAKNVRFTNCLITGNTATFGLASGGGIRLPSGSTVFMNNTVVADNKLQVAGNKGPDVFGTIFSAKNNFIGDGSDQFGIVHGVNGNQVGTTASKLDPVLGPLQNNGGPTPTRLPLMGSPLVDAGNTGLALDPMYLPLTTDQRGAGFPRVAGPAVDIGPVETPSSIAPNTLTGFQVDAGSQRSMVRSITVTFSQLTTFVGAPASAFQLLRTGPDGPTQPVGFTANVTNGATTSVELTFTGPLVETSGSLVDGLYQLTVIAGQIVGGFDGNSDGIAGDNAVRNFHRLFGDADGNGTVSAVDFSTFRLSYGGAGPSIFDYNNDGQVSAADFNQFRLRYGITITP